jgi:ATP-dependent DNA helicase RecG
VNQSIFSLIQEGESAALEFKTSFQKEVIEEMSATEISEAHIKLINSSWDYPMDALREIVINMIVHRDYRSANDSTIKFFDDRIEFFNPGTLLDNLTIGKIKTGSYKSHLRNKQIATIFKELDLIEKYGSGVRRVIETFIAYGLPEPIFETTQGGIAVTVFKQTAQKAPEETIGGVSALLEYITNNPGKRASELSVELEKPLRSIERWLKQLKADGLVEFQGAPKTGGYHARHDKS